MGVFVIAEAGVNHNGDLDLAKKMVDIAVYSGANAIKFQTFRAENLVVKSASKAKYQQKSSDDKESQFDMLKHLELSKDNHIELLKYCNEQKIIFLSTPFDVESVQLLSNLGLEIFKIPSGEITNLPYLRAIGSLNKKIILSTGMSSLGEIESAIDILVKNGTNRDNITILHANTEYPTPMRDVNLKAMVTIGRAFGLKFGYSDHTLGIEIPIAAVAMGASIIEKHFTLDKTMKGPDHSASLEPKELKEMIQAIRNIELALGDGIKKVSESEQKNILVARKSIIAKAAIKKGEIFTEQNLSTKRPANGINPMFWYEIVGKKANKNYDKDDLIEF